MLRSKNSNNKKSKIRIMRFPICNNRINTKKKWPINWKMFKLYWKMVKHGKLSNNKTVCKNSPSDLNFHVLIDLLENSKFLVENSDLSFEDFDLKKSLIR